MKNRPSYLLEIPPFLLILLWVYTASSKLIRFKYFEVQIFSQTLPHWLSLILIYTLPEIELIAAALLLFQKTRIYGLYLSGLLLLLFTGYVGLVLLNFFGRVPCSCGGVIKLMGWKVHFLFNIFFLLLTAMDIFLVNREGRMARQ